MILLQCRAHVHSLRCHKRSRNDREVAHVHHAAMVRRGRDERVRAESLVIQHGLGRHGATGTAVIAREGPRRLAMGHTIRDGKE